MKNVWIAGGILVILVFCAVGYYKLSKATKITPTMTSAHPTQATTMFSSIQDALNKSLSLSCSFTDSAGRHTTAYIKNGAIRADVTSTDPQQTGSIIVKTGKMYFWNSHEAVIIDIPTPGPITPNPTQAASQSTSSEAQNIQSSMEQYKSSCHVAVVADSLFVPPSNVTFTDMSAIMAHPTSGPIVTGVPIVNNQNYQNYINHIQPTQ